MPKLEGAPVRLLALREHARTALMAAIDAVVTEYGETIRLVLDPALSGPLGLIAEPREFRQHGVDKIFHLEPVPPPAGNGRLVYIVRPELESARAIARQLKSSSGSADGAQHVTAPQHATLHFVPRRSLLCEKLLGELGVYDRLDIRELSLHLIPLENDVLSLERPCFCSLFLDGDYSVLHSVAASIVQLEQLYGPIRAVCGKGTCSRQVAWLVQQMRPSCSSPTRSQDTNPVDLGSPVGDGGRIKRLVLLDRLSDIVTPLLTELTYEGLIHSLFGIKHGYVDLEPSTLGLSSNRYIKRELNSNDALYAQIRNCNFGDVGPLLRKLSYDLSEGYEERHTAHTVSQIREFMRKLSKLQSTHKSLSMHVHLAEKIHQHTSTAEFHARIAAEQQALANAGATADGEEELDEAIGRGGPLASVLRLACLFSVVGNGIKEKKLKALHSELIAQYGYDSVRCSAGSQQLLFVRDGIDLTLCGSLDGCAQVLLRASWRAPKIGSSQSICQIGLNLGRAIHPQVALTLNALHKVGLLRRADGRSVWPALCKTFDLVADDVPEVAVAFS